jgi:hypothetical protein
MAWIAVAIGRAERVISAPPVWVAVWLIGTAAGILAGREWLTMGSFLIAAPALLLTLFADMRRHEAHASRPQANHSTWPPECTGSGGGVCWRASPATVTRAAAPSIDDRLAPQTGPGATQSTPAATFLAFGPSSLPRAIQGSFWPMPCMHLSSQPQAMPTPSVACPPRWRPAASCRRWRRLGASPADG